MGLQLPSDIGAQTTTESHFRASSSAIGSDISRAGEAKGVPDYRGSPNAGPRAHVYRDSTQAPVASVIGFLKRKSAIAIAKLCGKERNFTGEHFWARGYPVSTVGFELEQVRTYIREQDAADGAGGQF
jgi:putative transposase